MRRHFSVLAAYGALTILLTWPLAAQFTTAVPGGGDAWQHIWNLWWMREALVDLHTSPFFTTYLYYPHGVSLLFHTLVPLESALTVPFQLLGVDLVPLYNSVLAASFILSGYATWLLVRDLTGHDGAAFVAGVAFAFCPYHLGHLLGHMNLVSLQWIPFYCWALFRACGAPGTPVGGLEPRAESTSAPHPPAHPNSKPRIQNSKLLRSAGWPIVAGLFLVANALTEWIYVAFLGVFTVGYLLWRLAADTRGAAAWRAWPPLLARLGVIGLVAGVLAGPLFWRTVQAQQGQDWMKFPPRETLVYSSDVVDSFVPSALHPFWGAPARELERRQPERNIAERSVFVGYTVLGLALLGVAAWRRRTVVFWGLTALAAWLLSLGPVLHVNGRGTFTSFNSTIPLPYLVLYSLVPGFSVMRVPSRFIVLASLALAVLVAFGLTALMRWWAGRAARGAANHRALPARPARAVLYASITALIALEFLVIPYPMSPPSYHIPFYEQVAKEPGDFAILELPLRPMADYEAFQTVHGKRLVYGYLSRQPPDPFIAGTPVLQYLLNATAADGLTPGDAAAGAAALRAAGVRYAVVHWWAFTPAEAATLRTKLAAIFPAQAPSLEDPADQLSVYTLGGGAP
ncbi:MAG TPA: hypothetical protein VM536_21960 [Chloroflexia bacterium]|nr:hypothetical protein [Chloroflexia bacterium]